MNKGSTEKVSATGIEVLYFSNDDCQVCKVLKPKVTGMIQRIYPEVNFSYINVRENPSKAANSSVFTVPTVLIQVDRKEAVRFVRSFGVDQIQEKLTRYYKLYYQ